MFLLNPGPLDADPDRIGVINDTERQFDFHSCHIIKQVHINDNHVKIGGFSGLLSRLWQQ